MYSRQRNLSTQLSIIKPSLHLIGRLVLALFELPNEKKLNLLVIAVIAVVAVEITNQQRAGKITTDQIFCKRIIV